MLWKTGCLLLNMPHPVLLHSVNKPFSFVRGGQQTLNPLLLIRSLLLVSNSGVNEEQQNTKENIHRKTGAPYKNGKQHRDIKSPKEIHILHIAQHFDTKLALGYTVL